MLLVAMSYALFNDLKENIGLFMRTTQKVLYKSNFTSSLIFEQKDLFSNSTSSYNILSNPSKEQCVIMSITPTLYTLMSAFLLCQDT